MKYEHEWIVDGERTVYAISNNSAVLQGVHYYSCDGSYLKVNNGFQPQHCHTKVFPDETQARQEVIRYAINKHQKEIRRLKLELDRLSKPPKPTP